LCGVQSEVRSDCVGHSQRLCPIVWSTVRGYVRLCGAQSEVMSDCVGHSQRLCSIVWSTVRGYVRLCGAQSEVMSDCVEHSQRLCSIVWSTVRGYVRLCRAQSGYVRLCQAQSGYVRLCGAQSEVQSAGSGESATTLCNTADFCQDHPAALAPPPPSCAVSATLNTLFQPSLLPHLNPASGKINNANGMAHTELEALLPASTPYVFPTVTFRAQRPALSLGRSRRVHSLEQTVVVDWVATISLFQTNDSS
jgi:hypothetical protein